MKRYLERTDEASAQFWAITLDGDTFTTTAGPIGTEGQTDPIPYRTLEAAIKTFHVLVQEHLEQGYRIKDHPYRVITWEEVEHTFAPGFAAPWEEFADALDEIRLYEADEDGTIVLRGDFVLKGDMNAVFDGHLVVDGTIEMTSNDEEGNFCYVRGDVHADSLLLHNTSAMKVTGNLTLKHGIVGAYGDNGGSLEVIGETTAEVIVADTYFVMAFTGAVTAVVINLSYPGQIAADYDRATFAEAVLDELMDGEGGLNERKVYDYVLTGQNILKQRPSSSDAAARWRERQVGVLLRKAYDRAEGDDPVGALALFDQVLALHPDQPEALYSKACMLYEMGNAAAALATLEQLDPDYGSQSGGGAVWYYKSRIYLATQHYQAALHCSERAIASERPIFPYWEAKAQALEGLGRHAEAQTARAEFHHRWGLIPFRRIRPINREPGPSRDREEALAEFDMALAADPDYWPALRDRAIVLAQTERASEVADILAAAVEREPEESLIWAAYGHATLRLHRYGEALAAFERAIALEPLYVYWDGKAQALEGLSRHTEAQTARAESQYRQGLPTFQRLMGGEGYPSDQTETLSRFDAALAADPAFWPAVRERAIVLARTEQAGEALDTLASAAEQEPENTALWAAYGHALYRLHRSAEALAAFEQAIDLAPDDADAWTGKGAALASLGRLDEAEAAFARTLDLNDRNVAAWFNRINAFVQQGRYDEALETLQVALRLDEGNAQFWGIQGKAQRAVALDDSVSYDWHSLAYSLYKLGRYEEALTAIERAIQIDPAPAIVGTKGEIFNGMGRYAEALDWLDRALAVDPNDREHRRERVVALRGLGRFEEANAAEAEIEGA